MITMHDANWEISLVTGVLGEFLPHPKVAPVPGMDPSPGDMYSYAIEVNGKSVLLVISWEAMVSALNNESYRRNEFRGFLFEVVNEVKAAKGNVLNYVLATRGLRKEPPETDMDALKAYGALEEGAKIGDQFAAAYGRPSSR